MTDFVEMFRHWNAGRSQVQIYQAPSASACSRRCGSCAKCGSRFRDDGEPVERIRGGRLELLKSAEQHIPAAALIAGVAQRNRARCDKCLVGQLAVTIQIFAEGAADVCERHIVDRRPGYARLDPLDIGEIRLTTTS